MKAAWAVTLRSGNYNRIFCVFAESQEEAYGKAFKELSEMLQKDNEYGEKVKDYRVELWTWATIPDPTGMTTNTTNFDHQIRQIRTK